MKKRNVIENGFLNKNVKEFNLLTLKNKLNRKKLKNEK